MPKLIWTLENLQKEALKYSNRTDFCKFSSGAYDAAWKRGLLNEICTHIPASSNERWTKEELFLEARKYKSKAEFKKNNQGAYCTAYKRPDFESICSHMDVLWKKKWSLDSLKLEALKYNNIKDFLIYNYNAYQAAYKKGLLKIICSHMPPPKNEAWTVEELQIEALKYSNKVGFFRESPAYSAAHKRGIIDKICSHMENMNGSSLYERELLHIIKNSINTAKKLRDKKVKIEGKPYIKGFEIDIFVPELCKGIEFDGTYWHSFDVMRSDPKRVKWSDEDIKNYHELKDSWFASKGIQILHIKEEDWNNNKEECVKICLEFLGVK